MTENKKEPILVRRGKNTRKHDDPDDARYVIIETEEEKEYLEWLVEKGRYSVIGLRSKLTGMRLYKEWKEGET